MNILFAFTKLHNQHGIEPNISSLNGCLVKTKFDMMKIQVQFLQNFFFLSDDFTEWCFNHVTRKMYNSRNS
jgi:hypothetical protein